MENFEEKFNRAVNAYNNKNYETAFNIFNEINNGENVEVLNYLGEMYVYGHYVQQDLQKAYDLLLQSAENQNIKAQFLLAQIYNDKQFKDSNLEEAIYWFTSSAEGGNAEAQYALAKIYANKELGHFNAKFALKWCNKAVEQGNDDAKIFLGTQYFLGDIVEQDLLKVYDLVIDLAESGNAVAENMIGNLYSYDNFENKDTKKAIEWFNKSAEQNYVYAQYNLGLIYKDCYEYMDIDKAISYFEKAANNGHQEAHYNLGLIYKDLFYNNGTHFENAMECFEKLAKQGHVGAQYHLGLFYTCNEYECYDIDKATYWFEQSANQGHDMSQYMLGRIYQGKDLDKAIYWLEQSANNGCHLAKHLLGVVLMRRGDFDKALYWAGNSILSQKLIGEIYYRKGDMAKAIECFNIYSQHIAKQYSTINSGQPEGAMKFNDVGDGDSEYYLFKIYSNYLSEFYNASDAREHLFKAVECGDIFATFILATYYYYGNVEFQIDEDIEKAYKYFSWLAELELGEAEWYLGCIHYFGKNGEPNLDLALKHFKNADKLGCSCDFSISMVKRAMGQSCGDNKMRECAEKFVDLDVLNKNVVPYIENELINDFGSVWYKLFSGTQMCLFTGMFTYYIDYLVGLKAEGNIDASNAISPMIKALEIELGYYLFEQYVEYLNDKKVPISEFKSGRCFIAKEGANASRYKNKKELKNFTLGHINQLIGLENITKQSLGEIVKPEQFEEIKRIVINPNEVVQIKGDHIEVSKIDAPFYEYLTTIFNLEKFDNNPQKLTEYIIDFANEVKIIADTIRNPAAHINVMSISKAEDCGNYLIKSNKLIKQFLEKLKI